MKKATLSQIMTSANLRAKTEVRSKALRESHKAAKGTLVAPGKVILTAKQQSRLFSNYTNNEPVETADVDMDNIDFAMF